MRLYVQPWKFFSLQQRISSPMKVFRSANEYFGLQLGLQEFRVATRALQEFRVAE